MTEHLFQGLYGADAPENVKIKNSPSADHLLMPYGTRNYTVS